MSRGGRTRAVVLVALLGLVASACGDQPEPTVRLQNVQADIVFGEITPPTPATPANLASGPLGPIDEDVVEVDEIEFDDKGHLRGRFAPSRPVEPCPPAELTEFPDKEASLNVEGKPAIGLYRWVRSGEQQVTTPAGSIKVPVSGFEKRLIRAVEAESDTTFTFETVQSELGTGQIVVTRYRVKTVPTQQRVGPTDIRVGEPDRGIAIYEIERFDPKTAASISVFAPNPPVLVLPLPVVPGEAFEGLGVDPATGGSLRIQGSVRKRQQVDACGEVVDGWLVEGSRTTSGFNPEDSKTQVYHYIVATQLGGPIIQEYLESQDTTGSAKITFRVGQIVPDPLPADAAAS